MADEMRPIPLNPFTAVPSEDPQPQQGFVDHDASEAKGGIYVNDGDLDDGSGVNFKRPMGKT